MPSDRRSLCRAARCPTRRFCFHFKWHVNNLRNDNSGGVKSVLYSPPMSVVSDRVVSSGCWEKLLEDILSMPSINGANTSRESALRVQTSGECQRLLTMLM